MREIIRFNVLLEAETPVAHHSESIGNTAIAMRRKIRQPDGSFANVPIITGDTMRHGLREAGAYALLRAANLLGEHNLSEAALRLLFAGGMITGSQDAVKLDEYHRMCELCPPLALLGGCVMNRSIPGRLQVDDALLVCSETAKFMPTDVTEYLNAVQLQSCRAHVEEVMRVRMDPMLNPAHAPLLLEASAEAAAKKLKKSEKASESNDSIAKLESKSTMMPRSFETVVQGSLFLWGLSCTCTSDLDVDTLHTMVGEFLSRPVVGGKRGVGCGRLRPVHGWKVIVTKPSEVSTEVSLARPAGELFSSHVAARADQVKEWLRGVVA
jgi:CRISPR type IV-associated protein Csf2